MVYLVHVGPCTTYVHNIYIGFLSETKARIYVQKNRANYVPKPHGRTKFDSEVSCQGRANRWVCSDKNIFR